MREKQIVRRARWRPALIVRMGIVLLVAASGLLGYVRGPVSGVLADSDELAAIYKDGIVTINIPYDEHIARGGMLNVAIVDPADNEVGSNYRRVASGREIRSWRVPVYLDKLIGIEDLAWYRLKISGPEGSRVVSLSEILKLPVIRLFAQRSYAAGSEASVRVITAESRAGTPLRDSRIKVELVDGDAATELFSGRTDAMGTARIAFRLPADSYGSREFRVKAETVLGPVTALESIQIERRARILLTTDKPIYQPAQTIHVRALALDGPTRAAAAGQSLTIEIEDGKGNKVFKKRGLTDRFGIGSADFELADQVNFGSYHIRAILGDEKSQTVQEKTVTVDRYVLPKFKLAIELSGDRKERQIGYYKPGDTVEGKVSAAYIFGKPISGADVTVALTTFDVQQVEIGRITGKTDAEGFFKFSSRLPDFFAGRSTQQGSAPVSINAEVKDTAQHTESKARSVLVSKAPIVIMAVPESGRLLPGLQNQVGKRHICAARLAVRGARRQVGNSG